MVMHIQYKMQKIVTMNLNYTVSVTWHITDIVAGVNMH